MSAVSTVVSTSNSVVAANNETFKVILNNSLEGLATQLADKYTSVDKTDAIQLAHSLASSIQLPAGKRVLKPAADEVRCCARTYDDGVASQCPFKRAKDVDFCTRHNKMAIECSKPLQFDEKGKHIGLFFGRVDEPLSYIDDDNKICVLWTELSDDIQSKVDAGMMYHPHCVKPKASKGSKASKETKVKAPKPDAKPSLRTKNAYMFFLNAKREEIKTELQATNPKVSVTDVTKKASEIWKALSDEEKAPFNTLAHDAKEKAKEAINIDAKTVTKPKKERKPKDEKVSSSRTKNAYMFFLDAKRNEIKTELALTNPKVSSTDVTKKASEMWKAMTDVDKIPYNTLAIDAKINALQNQKSNNSSQSNSANSSDNECEPDDKTDDTKSAELDGLMAELTEQQSNNDEVEATPIDIDGTEYYIDQDNTLYNEEGVVIGKYDNVNKKIIAN
jgi:hypothetical protein